MKCGAHLHEDKVGFWGELPGLSRLHCGGTDVGGGGDDSDQRIWCSPPCGVGEVGAERWGGDRAQRDFGLY